MPVQPDQPTPGVYQANIHPAGTRAPIAQPTHIRPTSTGHPAGTPGSSRVNRARSRLVALFGRLHPRRITGSALGQATVRATRQARGRLAGPLAAAVARLALLGRTVRSATAVVTPLGWLTLTGGILSVLVGRRLGWVEFQVLGATGLLCLAFGLAWTLGRSNFAITLGLLADRVTVGDTAVVRVGVRNRSARPSWAARAEIPIGARLSGFTIPTLKGHAEHDEGFQVPTRRRSVIVIGPVRSVRGDPLGLIRRVRTWTDPVELYVRPRTVRLHGATTGFLRDVEGITTQDLSSSDVSFHALRDYVPGDDRRAVHWKSTARVGRLIVRQFEETRRAHLLLVLSIRDADYPNPDDFETAVAVIGSLAQQALTEQREVSVVAGQRPTGRASGADPSGLLRFTSGGQLLDQLCRLTTTPDTPSLGELTGHAIGQVPAASVVAVITGTGSPPAEFRAAKSRIPLNAVSFGLRCAAGDPQERRSVGGLALATLPAIDDLPRALRAVVR